MAAADQEPARSTKASLRAQVLSRRDALSQQERDSATRVLLERAGETPCLKHARTVLAYASFGAEIQTLELLQACLRQGKRLVLPRVDPVRRQLDLFLVRDLERDLAPGTWKIPEPRPERCEPLPDRAGIDVVLAPGVAFTERCERMGYGGGFYDRLLSHWPGRGCFIALAYDLQIVDTLEMAPHDVLMHEVITPTRHFRNPSKTHQL